MSVFRLWVSLLLLLLAWQPASAGPRIRVIVVDPEDSSFALAANDFKSRVEAQSKGTIGVEVECNGLWNRHNLAELDIVKAVREGVPEMAIVTTGPMTNYAKALDILDTPFLFNDYAQVERILDGPVGRRLLDSIDAYGLRGLCFMDSGFRVFSSSRPINGFDDFKNVRVRVMQSGVYINFIRLIGAIPVPAPVDKIHEMASKGYIDAADRSYPTYWSYKLYDVQKYIIETNHAYAAKAFIINEGFFQKLSPADRKIVTDAAVASRLVQRRKFKDEIQAVKLRCKERGITIVHMSEADRQRMRSACKPIYDELSTHLDPDLKRELGLSR